MELHIEDPHYCLLSNRKAQTHVTPTTIEGAIIELQGTSIIKQTRTVITLD